MKILITGASGFIGQQLCKQLAGKNHRIIPIVRSADSWLGKSKPVVKNINLTTNWSVEMHGIDAVIHLANRAHVMEEKHHNPYSIYRAINIDATINLAKQAMKAGVKRFIYMSSIKVYGEKSGNQPYTEVDSVKPEDAYGSSKHEAEKALQALCKQSDMELVIIRPPLVYGPEVKANFLNLIKLCNNPLPLPFGAIYNKRSFVYIENLISLIETCLTHPKAANQTFLVSDNDDQSTSELISTIRIALGKAKLLVPVPQDILVWVFNILGRKALTQRLIGNLQVDITKARSLLGWSPPYTFKEGINKTIAHYNNNNDQTSS